MECIGDRSFCSDHHSIFDMNFNCEVEKVVSRQAHNLKVAGSTPALATLSTRLSGLKTKRCLCDLGRRKLSPGVNSGRDHRFEAQNFRGKSPLKRMGELVQPRLFLPSPVSGGSGRFARPHSSLIARPCDHGRDDGYKPIDCYRSRSDQGRDGGLTCPQNLDSQCPPVAADGKSPSSPPARRVPSLAYKTGHNFENYSHLKADALFAIENPHTGAGAGHAPALRVF